MIPKWKSGNGIIQTGNGIIYHFFSHWMKKLILQKFHHLVQGLVFRNRKRNDLTRKWNYFSPFQLSDQKTSFTKVTPFGSLIPKWFAETGNGIT